MEHVEYRAVGKRCAVDLAALGLPIDEADARGRLAGMGFTAIHMDMTLMARDCVGSSEYSRGALLSMAPTTVDCSSFTKWLYAQRGIWLPRRSVQQRKCGVAVRLDEVVAGDLIFTTGHINYYDEDRSDGVGHVGIVTKERTIIHAASKELGVVESSIESFTAKNEFRGARRYVPAGRRVFTWIVPQDRDVETSDDFRWIILQTFPRE